MNNGWLTMATETKMRECAIMPHFPNGSVAIVYVIRLVGNIVTSKANAEL